MNYRAEFLHYELQESPPFGQRVDRSAVMQVPSRGTERTSWDSVHGVSCGAPNVITLSCKSRPPLRGSGSGAAAAATNTAWHERSAAGVTRACSLSRPRRLPPRATGPGVFVRLW